MIGRIVGAVLGWLAFRHPLGVLLGFAIGWYFDRGMTTTLRGGPQVDKAALQALFMQLLFTSLGRLAKADGRVSEVEIAHTEAIIRHMGLDADGRRQAIDWFRQGARQEGDYQALLQRFASLSARRPDLRRMLLEMLIQLTLADGVIDEAEQQQLLVVAVALGVPEAMFRLLLQQLQAQQRFRQQGGRQQQGDDLQAAYQALGVKASDSDQQIKKSWRKLMSEHHPDKLIAQGAPEAVVREATERSQLIQAAYDTIKKARRSV